MRQFFLPLISAALLAACGDGNPFDGSSTAGGGGGGGGETSTDDIPEVLRQNVNSVAYDPDAETLSITLDSLDASPPNATYTRQSSLDVGPYQAFEYQETPQQRRFIALFAASDRRNVEAGVVADGGQFGRYFGGGFYERTGGYTEGSGLASYAGSYAGVQNTGAAGTGFGPVRTSGDVLVNADFTDDSVNGGITNRVVVDTGDGLVPLNLIVTDIDDGGTFQGIVEYAGDNQRAGDYGGIFAGSGASDIAGVIVVNPVPGDNNLVEHGVFVLPRCGEPGDPACP